MATSTLSNSQHQRLENDIKALRKVNKTKAAEARKRLAARSGNTAPNGTISLSFFIRPSNNASQNDIQQNYQVSPRSTLLDVNHAASTIRSALRSDLPRYTPRLHLKAVPESATQTQEASNVLGQEAVHGPFYENVAAVLRADKSRSSHCKLISTLDAGNEFTGAMAPSVDSLRVKDVALGQYDCFQADYVHDDTEECNDR